MNTTRKTAQEVRVGETLALGYATFKVVEKHTRGRKVFLFGVEEALPGTRPLPCPRGTIEHYLTSLVDVVTH